jgi:hypothetical protein
MAASRKPPWRRKNPKRSASQSRKLSPTQKAAAKRRAAKAGRPYPNLVDNMNAARRKRTTKR